MTNYLLLFTIGPVQSFIAQARKTQDLYAGSQLLSFLVKTAMAELKTKYPEVEFIFPKPQEGEDISYPNRFIASFPEANQDNLKTLGNSLKEKVIETFKNKFYIAAASNAAIKIEVKDNYCRQLDRFLDINWVILPYDPNTPEDYKKQYKEIERTLGAVKNVRDFDQLEELGRKCSLCGERNVLFCQTGSKGKLQLKPNWNNFDPNNKADQEIKEKINQYNDSIVEVTGTNIQKGEGLCAVCFSKRFYPSADNFPSTAKIALLDTIEELKKNGYSNLLKPYEEDKYDEQLIYEENLTEKYFEKFGLNKEDLKKLTENHKKIIEAFKNIENDKKLKLKLNKYYAIIALDGDNMGKWLSGKYIDSADLKGYQENLSEKLGGFASKVNKELFKENKGSEGALVYSGGDDVLAFVNLNHLIIVLKELKNNFPVFEGMQKSSASCGVAIAHYKTPLGITLDKAREMEKAAKKLDNKDAFGIAILKHSGEIEETVFKWGNHLGVIKLLEELIYNLAKEKISNTFIKNLNLEFMKLIDDKGRITHEGIIGTELKRLIDRSCIPEKLECESEKRRIQKGLSKKLSILAFNSQQIQNFLSFLHIADFLHREVNK